jgi:hypothetical protein
MKTIEMDNNENNRNVAQMVSNENNAATGRLGWGVAQMVNTETLVDDYELDYEAAMWAAKLK